MPKIEVKRIALYQVIVFSICTFASTLNLSAQESNLGNWLIYIGNKKFNSGWNLHNEIQYRSYNAFGDLEQLLIRWGVGRSFNGGNNNLLLGHGFILSENYLKSSEEKESVVEHRIFQQFISNQQIGKVKLNHRYRFEQRFVSDDFKMRFRYFLGLNVPLTSLKGKDLYFSGYNEIFVNSKSALFDRNRVYGGMGCKWNDQLRLELGYMNQVFEKSGRDQINIIAFFSF